MNQKLIIGFEIDLKEVLDHSSAKALNCEHIQKFILNKHNINKICTVIDPNSSVYYDDGTVLPIILAKKNKKYDTFS